MRLQQEIEEKEGHLEQAYSRLEAGEAPDDETAKEWIQILQKRSQRLMSMVTYITSPGSYTHKFSRKYQNYLKR